MKLTSLLIVIVFCIGGYIVYTLNKKDNNARKDAIKVSATVVKLKCKQRLKGDKSLVVLKYNSKEYSIFLTERKCNTYSLDEEVTAYYSKKHDKLFLFQ